MAHNAMRGLRAVLIAGAALGLAGCNTVSGMGTDMTSAWDWVTGNKSSSAASTTSGTTTASTTTSPAATTPATASGTTTPPAATTTATTGTPMVSRTTIREAQTKLKGEGLYKGKIDGIAGPQTHRAVLAYQKKENMTQTGTLDTATVNSLTGKM